MKLHEKIKKMRQINDLSREDMAEKLNLSASGYAKIEQGERGVDLVKLEKIAGIFQVPVSELLDKNMICVVNENTTLSNTYNAEIFNMMGEGELQFIIEKLNLLIGQKDELLAHKDELIAQLKAENQMLKDVIELLKSSKK